MKPSPLAALTLALFATGALPSAQRNVLLIVADDIGKADVGVYGVGNDPAPTPNIDFLASQGVRFNNAWSTPFCSPSRVAIQTGRHGYNTGVGHLVNQYIPGPNLTNSEITIAEMLTLGSGGAYTSGAFGKWHMGDEYNGHNLSPNIAGYDTYKGVRVGSIDMYFNWTAVHDGVEIPQTGYLTAQTGADVQQFVQNTPEPWFAYVAFHAPHTPLHIPPAGLHSFPNLPPGPPIGTGVERDYFKAMIEAMDVKIGDIINALGPAFNNTTIIFTSDNGTDGRWIQPIYGALKSKSTLFQGGINIPMIVSDPSITQRGTTSDALVHLVDIFATVADVAEIDLDVAMGNVELDSISFWPTVLDPTRGTRRVMYAEHFSPNGHFGPFEYYRKATRNDRYKLLSIDEGNFFFDLWNDPFETTNLLTSGTMTADEEANLIQLRDVMRTTGIVDAKLPYQFPHDLPFGLPDPAK